MYFLIEGRILGWLSTRSEILLLPPDEA